MSDSGSFAVRPVPVDPQLIATATKAQSEKLRAVLERLDEIARLDRDSVNRLAGVIDSIASNGGCGIGCW